MGAVWRAVDTTLDHEVAIKVLPPAMSEERLRPLIPITIAAAVIAVTVGYFAWQRGVSPGPAASSSHIAAVDGHLRIVVPPFENMGPSEDAYFAAAWEALLRAHAYRLHYGDRCIAVAPDRPRGYLMKAKLYFNWKGSAEEVRGALEEAPQSREVDILQDIWFLVDLAHDRCRESLARLERSPDFVPDKPPRPAGFRVP